MSHPLETVMRETDGFVLIGNSAEDRFPGFSYNVYTRLGKRFYCLDMGKLAVSRGPTKGGKVYHEVAELPADHDDLAIIWVKPHTATHAVELAHEAGCKRVWFSFGAGYPAAVVRARELGMNVVEIGRCPIYYLDDKVHPGCKMHTAMVKLTGLYAKPPQTDAHAKHREMM